MHSIWRSEFAVSSMARVLWMELQRAIFSARFFFGAFLMLLWMAANVVILGINYNIAISIGAISLFQLALDGTQTVGPVILAFSTLPYSFSYLTEQNYGFSQQIVGKIGVKRYGICKVLAVASSAFLMAALSMGGFLLIICYLKIPHTVDYEMVKNLYESLAATRGPFWYYIIRISLTSLACSLAAVFSLLVTTKIPNTYVGFISPLIGYYIVQCLLNLISSNNFTGRIGSLFSLNALFFGQPYGNSILFSFLWTIALLSSVIILMGLSFVLSIRKEHFG